MLRDTDSLSKKKTEILINVNDNLSILSSSSKTRRFILKAELIDVIEFQGESKDEI